jgi:hypothetical protein
MCSNKSNLLVALFRAAGIPAAYGILRVNAREYFGPLSLPFLKPYVSAESIHIYAAAYLDGRWVKCDASTDSELASKTAHFSRQTRLVRWDGTHDALDFIDPRHVYEDLGLVHSVDELLARPARNATPDLFAVLNTYLRFIRDRDPFPSAEALIEAFTCAPRTWEMRP